MRYNLLLPLMMLSILLLSATPNNTLELGSGKVAVMFWSELCFNCERILPVWRSIERDPPAGIKVIDIKLIPGKNENIFVEFGIKETPTIILFENGREVKRISGLSDASESYLRDWIEGKSGLQLISFAFPVLGGLLALSPCSLPIMMSLTPLGRFSRRRDYATCFISSALGVISLGMAFLLISSLLKLVVRWIIYALALFSVILGIFMILSPEKSCRMTGKVKSSFTCFSLGFLAMQCNLPLVIGSFMLLSASDFAQGIVNLISLSLGMSLTFLILVRTSKGISARLSPSRSFNVSRLGGALLILIGLYLIISNI